MNRCRRLGVTPLGAAARALALVTALLVAPMGLAGASAAAASRSITISGSISGMSGGRVVVLSAKGTGWSGTVAGSSFSVSIPAQDRAQLRDATVQVIAPSGSYAGPVVLKKLVEKAKGKKKPTGCGKTTQPACVKDVVGLGKVSGNLSLGRLVGKDVEGSVPTWFLVSKASRIDPRAAIRAAASDGRPYGAGNLGLVPHGGIPTMSIREAGARGPSSGTAADAGSGSVSESCASTSDGMTGTEPGQELDCSGVPNVLNVDVNGNGVLNDVDSSSASMAASTITVGATIGDAQQNAVSYYAPGGLTPASLATFLDPQPLPHQNPADFSFSVQPDELFPGDSSGSDLTMSVDCGSLAWCTNANAVFDDDFLKPVSWAQATPPYALILDTAVAKPFFDAVVMPPDGTDIPDEITPGQLIALNGTQSGSGATAQTMLEVGPYFASTPYITGATFTSLGELKVDSAGNSVSASPSGTVTLKVERPERLPLPGETTASGLMDTSGLNYWVSINQPGAVGGLSANCPPAAYSNVTGATIASQPDEYGTYTLGDDTTEDFDPAEADNPGPIEFTVDLRTCETDGTQEGGGSGYAWTPGQTYQVSVSAEGLDGSAGRTSEGFQIVAP
jgi:hypothetical protein